MPIPQLVGRATELEALAGALDDVDAGRGALFLLAGEPGIGKTRLADELAALAQARGMAVAWGRCWEAGGAPAYWPWTQALSSLLGTLAVPPRDLARMLGTGAADVAEIVPLVREVLPGVAPRAPGEGAQARFQILAAIHAFLRAAAAMRPIVLVLDDLHVADQSSLAVLQLVARELRGVRLLVLGAYRDAEVRRTSDVAETIGRIAREGRVLELRRLDREQTAELARRIAKADATTADAVYAASQGNPLFADEVLRHLAAHGVRREVALPYGVRDAIRQRLAMLPEEARAVLSAASVLGRDFASAAPADALGWTPDAVVDALALAAELGTVAPEPGGRYRFSHILVREVIYRDLSASRRAQLHAAAAAWLERMPASDRSQRLSEIAHHRSLGQGGPGLGAAWGEELARRMLAEAGFEDVRVERAPADPLNNYYVCRC